jgi:hypothetical protein
MTPTTIGENELPTERLEQLLAEAKALDVSRKVSMTKQDATDIQRIITELLDRRKDGLGTVGVKPLQWEATGPRDLVADSVVGQYVINRDLYSAGGYFNLWLAGAGDDDFSDYATLPEAKAAAQSDFETRVKSCLTSIGAEAFQNRVAAAHVALFHDDPTDLPERRDRFYEEATETVQALGMTEADAHALVSYTFGRPSGEPEKEIGAAALTLASLCVVGGWDMMACAEADLAAIVTPEKIAKVRAKRSTRHGRGPLPGVLS